MKKPRKPVFVINRPFATLRRCHMPKCKSVTFHRYCAKCVKIGAARDNYLKEAA